METGGFRLMTRPTMLACIFIEVTCIKETGHAATRRP